MHVTGADLGRKVAHTEVYRHSNRPIPIYYLHHIAWAVRACVCLSVCGHFHGRISSSIFIKLDTDV